MRLTRATRVLITGASCALGWTIARRLADRCQVTGTYLTHPCHPEGTVGARLDLADGASIEQVFRSSCPDVVIHAAATSDPDACERDPALALRINFEATAELAALARDGGSRLIFVSTDLVFDGAKGDYSEEDPAHPLSTYSASKLRAEAATLAADAGNLVLRSALIYGSGSPASGTFLARMLEALAEGRTVRLFTDQRRSPVLADDLAEGATLAIEKDLAGLYHLGGAEALSRHEFGQQVCRVFGYRGDLLVPVKMADFAAPARRPLDATLDSSKFRGRAGFSPCGVREGLRRLREARSLD